jgi:FdhD protein
MDPSQKELLIMSYSPEGFEKRNQNVIVEALVGISINGKHFLNLMCTPCDLDALAVGFIYNEGVINSIDEIKLVEVSQNRCNIDIWLDHSVKLPEFWQRTSGCNGGATSVTLDDTDQTTRQVISLIPEKINLLTDQLLSSQNLYTESGGVHSSALSDGKKILVVMEDIGRHNTLDKISGKCLMETGFPKQSILLTTGRISSEMLQKSARMGVSAIISRTSPSSLSIEFAQKLGICLIGYARKDRFKIYTHIECVYQKNGQE